MSASESKTDSDAKVAPRLQNLGDHHFAISTDVERAQQFFDQGLRLAYGFNHREAERAFRETARVDPDCAMAYWGIALVNGPNLNKPMTEEGAARSLEAIRQAEALSAGASEREQAYITALSTRYADDGRSRSDLDAAYAAAMGELSAAYPDDDDAATLYAAALMNTMPWDYWTPNGQPRPNTDTLVATLEKVLARTPDHPGANHYLIHALESVKPERAEGAADRLGPLMPGAGHMVHMPSHIYARLGRYEDAVEANLAAIAADEDYITQCRAQGIYPLAYYPHNIHFLWAAQTRLGRSSDAIASARKVRSKIAEDQRDKMQNFVSVPLYALVRFGRWEEILAEPEPPASQGFVRLIWHYARGTAFAWTNRFDEAEAELTALRALSEQPAPDDSVFWSAPPRVIDEIAEEVLAGELASLRGDDKAAIQHLDRAVRLQDELPYTEPPDWHYPLRHSLGPALLSGGKPVQAEAVYREDLRMNPKNGRALFGLVQAMRAQNRFGDAFETEKRFEAAWSSADYTLTTTAH